MKLIIAGSRHFTSSTTARELAAFIEEALAPLGGVGAITEVVSGCADGVDTLGAEWARSRGIPVKEMPARWEDIDAPGAVRKFGRNGRLYNAKAGHDRNLEMAQYADALVLYWNGKSPGSKDMLRQAKARGLTIFEKIKTFSIFP